jgi:uncharacterized membrane protein YgcG
LSSAICDSLGYLSENDKDILEGLLNEVNATGAIAVADVIPASADTSTSSISSSEDGHAKNFSDAIFYSWGLNEYERSFLIMLAIEDRQMYVSVSAAFTGELHEDVLQEVMSHMKPSLQQGRIGDALKLAVVEISLLLKQENILDANTLSTIEPAGNKSVSSRLRPQLPLLVVMLSILKFLYDSRQHSNNLMDADDFDDYNDDDDAGDESPTLLIDKSRNNVVNHARRGFGFDQNAPRYLFQNPRQNRGFPRFTFQVGGGSQSSRGGTVFTLSKTPLLETVRDKPIKPIGTSSSSTSSKKRTTILRTLQRFYQASKILGDTKKIQTARISGSMGHLHRARDKQESSSSRRQTSRSAGGSGSSW